MLTVGEIFKSEREKKRYSLSHVAKKIRVREKLLNAIEENNWNVLTSKIYIEGIIKNYGQFLGLDSSKLLAFFRRDYEKSEEVSFHRAVSDRHLIPESKTYKTIALAVLISAFIAYFTYQVKLYVSPPKVELVAPKETTFKRVDHVRIIGRTEKEAVITIFKDRVFQNKEGIFVYDFTLSKGKNVLTIEVVGANGKKTTLTKEFYLNP